jgi:hypothetical protein
MAAFAFDWNRWLSTRFCPSLGATSSCHSPLSKRSGEYVLGYDYDSLPAIGSYALRRDSHRQWKPKGFIGIVLVRDAKVDIAQGHLMVLGDIFTACH